jgi:hypothetical protein
MRFKFLFYIELDLRADMWLFPIGSYQFGWIDVVVRWIKIDLDIPDGPVPLRLSGSIRTV